MLVYNNGSLIARALLINNPRDNRICILPAVNEKYFYNCSIDMDLSKQHTRSNCSINYISLAFILIGIAVSIILLILLWKASFSILETVQYIYISMPTELSLTYTASEPNVEEEHIYEEIR